MPGTTRRWQGGTPISLVPLRLPFQGTHWRKELRLPIYYYFEEIDQYVKDVHGLH